ncbi:procollagen galactosyltransferase 1-like [Rhopilema esculentum]|uniref:procollagen galactosyltransferase 1-like n=1 Tax=Rhopilema esculentum TaxID=499914 RepID=UPI0031E31296
MFLYTKVSLRNFLLALACLASCYDGNNIAASLFPASHDLDVNNSQPSEKPTILISIIARNEEKTLPTYLGYIERLNYPKEKISILIQTDHNEDKTEQRLKEWIKHANLMYKKIKFYTNSSERVFHDAAGPNDWSPSRYEHVSKLRQRALDEARSQALDYLLVLDCDNFLLNPNTIEALMAKKKTVVAPMIRAFNNETTYSNYWCGMDEQGYYKRMPDYFPILLREKVGCFEVPMVHSTYLIELRQPITKGLRYFPPFEEYHGEIDDILLFAYSARKAGIKLYILNEDDFGRMLSPQGSERSLEDDQIAFTDAKVDWIAYYKPLIETNLTNHRPPPIDNLGFDEIYMINLARRPDRRKRMLMSLQELGLLANEQDAVDGKTLTKEIIDGMGIQPMKDFQDPYLERPITMGEVGCFLSHWNIWKEIVANKLEYVLVLEDDVRFEPDFVRKMREVLQEAKDLLWDEKWDLIYVGRKRMSLTAEERMAGTKNLVWARYSYWTLAYIMRLSGAQKLIAGEPLKQLIPVDEYIPIMFNDHNEYVGRKRMSLTAEERMAGTKNLVWARYSYWTLAYIMRLSGAQKLIAGEPLKQLIPVDEYIPIMFNDHNDKELMSKFPVRNLVALSVHPLLVYPTHYVGDSGYVSDTEDTVTVFKENATANNATDNTTAEVNNEKEGSIAERRFEQRRTTSQLQGDL